MNNKEQIQTVTNHGSRSVSQFSHSVLSDFLWPHGLEHTRLPCPSPTPRTCSKSLMSIESVMPSNHHILCCPLLLPSVFSSIRVFSIELVLLIRWPNIGVSASASVLPVNSQDWFPLGWTSWISQQSKGLSRVFSNTTVQKTSILWCSAFFMVYFSHPYMTTEKSINLIIWVFVGKVMSLLFNILSKFVIAFQMMIYCD